MKHIVNVSGGAASAVVLFRVIERFGKADVVARFADTLEESPDLYRFLDDLERAAGVSIERLADGRDIWQVFRHEVMWTNPKTRGCIASRRLKRDVLNTHLAAIDACCDDVIYIGYDPSEQDRIDRLLSREPGFRFDFPLLWFPKMLRCDQEGFLHEKGLKPCDMYDRGYSHANCGGTCIRAGIGQWSMVLRDYPERYAKAEAAEAEIMAEMARRGRTPQSILRTRVGGLSRNLTLTELREAIERGERPNGDESRLTACSCGGDLLLG